MPVDQSVISLQSAPPSGVTKQVYFGKMQRMYIARGALLEMYLVKDGFLHFQTSKQFEQRVVELYQQESNLLVCMKDVALLLHGTSLSVVAQFNQTPPGGEAYEFDNVMYAKVQNRYLICIQENQIGFTNLLSSITQFTNFRVGKALSIASSGDTFAVLGTNGYADAGHVLHNNQNLRSLYLAIFDTQGDRITEHTRLNQLPYDCYKVLNCKDGYVVVSPKQFIFKYLNEKQDLRFRFAQLFEECEADVQYIQQNFTNIFEHKIEFDFTSLVSGKIVNDLANNQILEKQLINTIHQQTLPLAPKELIPGHFQLKHCERYPYYGYYGQEINMKLNQLINIMGDYPVFDYQAEAELGLNGTCRQFENLRYLGPLAQLNNFQQIPLLYGIQLCWLDDKKALVSDKYGKLYSLQFEDDKVRMLPVFIKEKTLPLFQRAGELSGMSVVEKTTDGFLVFMASFVNDSFVNLVEFGKEVPSAGFYKNFRENGRVTDQQFRKKLLGELEKNCQIITNQKATLEEEAIKTESKFEEVEFFGKKKKLNVDILKKLYPWRYDLPVQIEGGLFSKTVEHDIEKYEEVDHAIIQAVSVLISTGGMVDIAHTNSANNKAPSINALNYCGLLQTMQQEVPIKDGQTIDSLTYNLQAIYDVTRDPIDAQDNCIQLLVMKKATNEFLHFTHNPKTNAYQYDRKLTEQFRGDLYTTDELEKKGVQQIILAAKRMKGQVVVVTHVSIVIFDKNNKFQSEIPLKDFGTKEERIIQAEISDDGLISICSPKSFVIFQLDKKFKVCNDVVVINERCGENLQFISAHYHDFMDFPIDIFMSEKFKQQELGTGFVLATAESGVIYCVSVNLLKRKFVVNFCFSNLLTYRNLDYELHNIDDAPSILDQKINSRCQYASACRAHVTFVNQEPCKLYIFCQLKGGDFSVLHFHENWFKYLVQTCQGNTKLNKQNEDRFAHLGRRDDFRYHVQQPFTRFKQDHCHCIFLGYPQVGQQSEPHSMLCVENLNGALTFFNQGTQPSILLFADKQMTFDFIPPIRALIPVKKGIFAHITDYFSADKLDSKTSRIGVNTGFDFGTITSVMKDQFQVQMQFLKSINLFNLTPLQFIASQSNNSVNLKRNILQLPFQCQRMIYHRSCDAFIISSVDHRYEIRPTRNQTNDEVANIRIYQAREQNDKMSGGRMDETQLIEFCHALLQRDAPPQNLFSVLDHQMLFLVKDGLVHDVQSVKLCRMEKINCLVSESLKSNYPRFFGKFWVAYNTVQDKYGWEDRRMRNDDMENRQHILQKFDVVKGKKELVFAGTGYTMGSFCRQYGQVLIYTVELLDSNGVKVQTFQKNEFLKEGRQIDKVLQNRIPKGDEIGKYQLNQVCQEEFQSAITGLQCMPESDCLLVGESRLIYGYLLTDGQKLERCTQEMGFGFIMGIKRFQDFLLICDAFQDSKLYVYRNKGRRMTELTSVSKETVGIIGDILLNASHDLGEILVAMAFEKGKLGIFRYKYDTDKVGQREQMELVQVVNVSETISQIIKVPQRIPKPALSMKQSSMGGVVSTFEGGITQLIMVPQQVCQLAGVSPAILKTEAGLNYFDVNQRVGDMVTLDFSSVAESDRVVILQKIYKVSGAF